MAHANIPYRNACKISNRLLAMLLKEEDVKDFVTLSREWREVENTKREWRGVPRLALASIVEVQKARLARLRDASTASMTEQPFTDPDEERNLLPQPTVPAPPTPEPPSAEGLDMKEPSHSKPVSTPLPVGQSDGPVIGGMAPLMDTPISGDPSGGSDAWVEIEAQAVTDDPMEPDEETGVPEVTGGFQ